MVVGLELFIEDADAVPELGVLDVVQAIERALVGREGVLEVLDQQVAVAKGGPGRPVLGVDGDHLYVLLDGRLVVAVGGEELCQLVDAVHVGHHVVSVAACVHLQPIARIACALGMGQDLSDLSLLGVLVLYIVVVVLFLVWEVLLEQVVFLGLQLESLGVGRVEVPYLLTLPSVRY